MIMLSKKEKESFVKEAAKAMSKYTTVGVINLSGIPDNLLQKTRNGMRDEIRLILGKKNILERVLKSEERTEKLADNLSGTSAIVLSNSDPFDIYKAFKSNEIKLTAKPKQIAPADINIEAGETSLQPGQAVTELKQAGVDVQIQKGKVMISKSKVIVKKGEMITSTAAKVLHTLGVAPFRAAIEPVSLLSNGVIFGKDVLDISAEKTITGLSKAFMEAYTLCLEIGEVNEYTLKPLITTAYLRALALGLEIKAYEPGIIELLIGRASVQAAALGGADNGKS
jgi:large subunit ribosomal protein L10